MNKAIPAGNFSFCLITLLFVATLMSSCGKHESAGSAMGTATGAVIGASVAGRRDTGTGALIGGLVGNVIGGSMGRAADNEEKEAQQERIQRRHARQKAIAQQELERVKRENRMLKQKWCSCCNRQIMIAGAKSCTSCGGGLIHERYCRECAIVFSPQSGYRYCPYCPRGAVLSAR